MGILPLTKEERIQNVEKDSLLNKWSCENGTVMCKRIQLEHFLTPYAKIKL